MNRRVKAERTPQDAAYARRSAMTIFKDTLRLATDRLTETPTGPSRFWWEDERARMVWVLMILKTHPTGKVK